MTNAIEISFEFSPPRTAEMEASLWRAIRSLAPLRPRFVSVTYGAGGSTRERTHATVQRILHETDLEPAAHLTCVEATRAEVNAVVQSYRAIGVRHIVALRGDPPEGSVRFTPHPQGYRNAEELVRSIRAIADFEISVAAYPEVHPEALSPQADLDNLKRKLDAGASRAITQFFFDSEVYLRFVDRARAAGIGAPIVPGILPVTNFKRVRDFARKCGANVPQWLAELFDGLDNDPTTRNLVAAWVAADQCRKLQEHGVREFHFYTLNRAELTRSICHILGVRAESGPAKPARGAA
jgi:methylenetetrahydrofolate reductase (NADPH)